VRDVPTLLARRAADQPDRSALVVLDAETTDVRSQLTFRDWDRRSDRVAGALVRRGVRQGDAVGLAFPASDWPGFAVAYLGVQKAGGVAVPLGPHQGENTAGRLLEHCRAVGVIRGGQRQVPTPGWLADADELLDGLPGPVWQRPYPDAPAQILCTSGTTGEPKAVVASHANLTYGLRSRPRPMAHSNLCLHAFAMGTNAAQRMLVGGLTAAPTMMIASSFDPATFAESIQAHRVGSVFVVPTMAVALVKADVGREHDLSSVVLFGSTAAALPPDTATALAGWMPTATIVNTYTSTEASPAELTMVFDAARPTAVGRPDRPDRLRVTDARRRCVPPGTPGDIWLRSDGPPRSYLDTPAPADGWIPMGDVGHLDEYGYLHLLDRADDLIKCGGLPVSTIRVEAALKAHPSVTDAGVVGREHATLGQVPVAAVVLTGRADRESADLWAFLGERLDRHELPASIRVVTSLPRTASGKVVKPALRSLLAATADSPATTPGSATTTVLAGLWSRVLAGVDPHENDDFFGLGGDSLSATHLARLVGERFDVEVPAGLAFAHRTLGEQSDWLDRDARQTGAATAIAPGIAGTSPSGLQEHLLTWMHQTDPPRDVGPICVGLRVNDDLDVELLERCLAELVARHDALRTRYHRGGLPWTASVRADLAAETTFLRAEPATARGLLLGEISRPFDWREGPLVRLVVVSIDKQEHLLALVIHHLAVDGWSFGVLLRELGEIYSARRCGAEPALAPAVPAAVVAAHERAQSEAQRGWWKAYLDGAPAAVAHLPGRRHANRYDAAALDVPLGDGADAAATACRTSAFVVAGAAWLAVLAAHSGAHEVVVLTPVPGRDRPEFDGAVGCLARSLLVRVDLSGDPTVRTVVERFRDGLGNVSGHQPYPFAEFASAVPYPVEIPFSRWSAQTHFPGLVSEPYELPHGLVWHWTLPGPDGGVPKLDLVAGRSDGQLLGRLTYNRNAFDVASARSLGERLRTVLAPRVDLDCRPSTIKP